MFLRRSVASFNRVALASTLPRVSTRAITNASKSNFSGFESHAEIEVGDLVTYTEAGNKTEGIVQKIFEESSKTAQKNPPHLAEVQNYYTRKVSYSDLSNLKSVARNSAAAKEFEKMNSTAAKPTTNDATSKQQATPSNAKSTSTSNSTSSAKPTTHDTTSKSAGTTSTAKTAASTATSNAKHTTDTKTATSASNNKANSKSDSIEKQLSHEDSPLNADFAPGDIVRYRVAQNFTAGVVQELVYGITHDEAGNFHGASHENPMARLENLWTKKITYHHLNVLEHVKRAKDVTPGRFAESEFEVYGNKK